MLQVAVLVGPQFSLMGTAGALEMLDECAHVTAGGPPVQLHQVGLRAGDVEGRFSCRFRADLGLADPAPAFDLVIVPPIKTDLEDHLSELGPFLPWLRARHAEGTLLCSLCTGAFVLAETGLLDEGRAATHWAFAPLFRLRYPRVSLVEHAMLVEGDGVVMTGGALAFTNGLLFVVERLLGKDTSIALSRLFVVDRFREHQGAFSVFSTTRAHGDALVLRCQDLIETEHATLEVDTLARRVGLSPRSLRRRFQAALGMGPGALLRRARIEAARHQLERTDRSVFEVMDAVGYADRKTFARAFKDVTGVSPQAYRRRHDVRVLAFR